MAKNREVISRGKILSEFFTNLAVAWFATGIIAPLFTLRLLSLTLTSVALAGTGLLIWSVIIIRNTK